MKMEELPDLFLLDLGFAVHPSTAPPGGGGWREITLLVFSDFPIFNFHSALEIPEASQGEQRAALEIMRLASLPSREPH